MWCEGYVGWFLPWPFCPLGILLQTPNSGNANEPFPHRAADLQRGSLTPNAWVCASELPCSAAAEHGEMHIQEAVPAEAYINQKEGKISVPSSSGIFSASFVMKLRCTESHQAADMERYLYSP